MFQTIRSCQISSKSTQMCHYEMNAGGNPMYVVVHTVWRDSDLPTCVWHNTYVLVLVILQELFHKPHFRRNVFWYRFY